MGLARTVHPLAWWAWAVGMAAGVLRSTNIAVSLLAICVAGLVVSARAPDSPWVRAFSFALRLGVVVVVVRVGIQVVFAPRTPGHELFTTPSVTLPAWMAGVSVGGPVTAESVLSAVGQGLRLAAVLCCFGAANSLTSPSRTVRALPAALYAAGVAVSVAVAVAPQAVISARRRIEGRRIRGLRVVGIGSSVAVLTAVLADSLGRAIAQAASMEVRGFGHVSGDAPGYGWALAVAGGAIGMCVGSYLMLAGSQTLGVVVVITGVVVEAGLVRHAGRHSGRSRFRPDTWSRAEWVTVAAALCWAAVVWIAVSNGAVRDAGVLEWPSLPWWVLLACGIAALPAVVTPPLPTVATGALGPQPTSTAGSKAVA
jgi:energy-coupling factor transport system permease protein